MKRLLITGATGFIGTHCLPLLTTNGYEVHAVTKNSSVEDSDTNQVNWHRVDLLDQSQIQRLIAHVQPTHLLHFAWYATPRKYLTSPENVRWVQASLALLQAFAENGGQRVVMAGTCAEYDWKYGYCSEEITPLIPATLYGTCKHSVQMIMRTYAEQRGLSSAWGRIFFLYGPHEHRDRLISYVIRSLLLGEIAHCSHGRQLRDFLYVKDVASAFVALLDSVVIGPVNIASGQPTKLLDVIYAIADLLNRRELIQLNSISTPPDEPPLIVADIHKLSNEVRWLPEFDFKEGLTQTIEWWRHNLALNKSEPNQ